MEIDIGLDQKELESLTKRVVKLLDIEIDDIWFHSGWRSENLCKNILFFSTWNQL